MAQDVWNVATSRSAASLLLLGAVVAGGSYLVAMMLDDFSADDSTGSSATRLHSASRGLGSRNTDTLARIRDAAFSFALAKAVDTVEEMFPGFREHYERAAAPEASR